MYQNKFLFKGVAAFLFFFISFWDAENCIAQDQKIIDSLRQELIRANTNQKYEIYMNLFIQYMDNNNLKSFEMASLALEFAILSKDTSNIVKAYRAHGFALTMLGKNKDGVESFSKGLRLAEEKDYRELQKYLLNNLANTYNYMSNYDKALEFHFKSLVIREEDGKPDEVAIAYNNIGLVYYKLKDFDRALEYYTKALRIKEEVKITYDLDRLRVNMSLCLIELREFKRAIEQVNEAYKICGSQCSDRIRLEGSYALGMAHLGLRDLNAALSFFEKSYALAEKLNDQRFVAENLVGISNVKLLSGNVNAALSDLKKAESILINSSLKDELIRVYKDIAELYKNKNDFTNASLYQGKYIELKDSVFSDNLLRNLTRVQTDFEERENLATIAAKDQLIIMKEEALAKQRRLNFAIGIIAALFISLALVLYQSAKSKQKANMALQEAKQTIEQQNEMLEDQNEKLEKEVAKQTKELQLTNKILADVNNELDNFIYKISHDIRGPLATLKGLCVVAISDVRDEKGLDYLKKLGATADKLNYILSRLMTINHVNNVPLNLQSLNLDEFMSNLIPQWKDEFEAKSIDFKLKNEINQVLKLDHEMIKTILENLISNAIKFSKDSSRHAAFIEVIFTKVADRLIIKVIDNGIGIQEADNEKMFHIFSRASEKSDTGGVGLYLTKIATHKMQGTASYTVTPEGNTEFLVSLPFILA